MLSSKIRKGSCSLLSYLQRVRRMSENGEDARRANRKPRLICFDLDWTLWPFHVDTNPYPPMKMGKDGKIHDKHGDAYEPFPGTTEMFAGLLEQGYKMALVSRTEAPSVAREMLRLLDWNKYFPYQEIYAGRKTTHFAKIQKESEIPYKDMLFFDDEHRNVKDISAIGVTCVFVKEPMSQNLLQRGLDMFTAGKTDK